MNFYPVILAGGRGTRFWPLSRRTTPKQALALDGEQTMIQQTVERLLPVSAPENIWVITNHDVVGALRRQLPQLSREQIVPEPVGRNTAPAIGLAAFLLIRSDENAVLGLFPSDQVISAHDRFLASVRKAVEIAAAGENIVVMGVKPNRPETGYGYIEAGAPSQDGVLRVRKFREKPDLATAKEFLAAGNFFWNSGMFVWSARTLVNALNEHLPKTARLLEEIAASFGRPQFSEVFARLYPQCENISIDYAVLEPRSARGEAAANIYCIPAEFGWNDLGSWAALYEHRSASQAQPSGNVIEAAASAVVDANNNYLYSPKKFIAAVGVNDLVVVETDDAILVTTRDRSQDVGKIVKELEQRKQDQLL